MGGLRCVVFFDEVFHELPCVFVGLFLFVLCVLCYRQRGFGAERFGARLVSTGLILGAVFVFFCCGAFVCVCVC